MDALAAAGVNNIIEMDEYSLGAVSAVKLNEDGTVEAVADPRKSDGRGLVA